MIGPFAIYVVVDPKGDRPYVSTGMSAEFLKACVMKGCTVSKIDAEVDEEGKVFVEAHLRARLRAENWSPKDHEMVGTDR